MHGWPSVDLLCNMRLDRPRSQSLANRAHRQFSSSVRRRSPVESATTTPRGLCASLAGPRAIYKHHHSVNIGRRPSTT